MFVVQVQLRRWYSSQWEWTLGVDLEPGTQNEELLRSVLTLSILYVCVHLHGVSVRQIPWTEQLPPLRARVLGAPPSACGATSGMGQVSSRFRRWGTGVYLLLIVG